MHFWHFKLQFHESRLPFNHLTVKVKHVCIFVMDWPFIQGVSLPKAQDAAIGSSIPATLHKTVKNRWMVKQVYLADCDGGGSTQALIYPYGTTMHGDDYRQDT